MKTFFLILLFIFVIFFAISCYFESRYYNPWKLIFMWGAKGSGKSTTFTKLAYKYLKKGYDVYTDDLSCTR